MISELNRILEEIKRDRGIEKEVLVEALEVALITAAKKKYGPKAEIEARFNEETGTIELFQFKNVVKRVKHKSLEIKLEEAKELDTEAEIGDSLGVAMNTEDFGRITAQTVKQIITQKLRDAEGENIFNDFKDRKTDLVTGTVQHFERDHIIVNLGRTEGILPVQEQIRTESYKQGDRIKAYILDVKKTPRGPQIILSRTYPGLVLRLFEIEVPEIREGIVKIVNVAREPGVRAKISVLSYDKDVDPVGACVGAKGSRVQSVVQELKGEKIDIIPWEEDPAKFICNALAPAVISEVIIDKEKKSIDVIVTDEQLSLAIGKKGLNVRLAVKLTGWKVDIKSRSKVEILSKEVYKELLSIQGIGEITAEILYKEGFFTPHDLAIADTDELSQISGIGKKKAVKIKQAAEKYLIKRSQKEVEAEVKKLETSNELDLKDDRP
ncbi:MAG: transcription termination factor NusA [Thermodesulfobacteriota bacterium]|nr:transcription termination factor NusA [Thermodesulfobacteriota bacterium]